MTGNLKKLWISRPELIWPSKRTRIFLWNAGTVMYGEEMNLNFINILISALILCWQLTCWAYAIPVTIVVEGVVTGHGDETAKCWSQGVEDLRGGVRPHL